MAVCCQNLTLGALSSRSAISVLVGALFKKFRHFFEHAFYKSVCSILRHFLQQTIPFSLLCSKQFIITRHEIFML
jgi:hypothetical protein